jgi:hypothetical protein
MKQSQKYRLWVLPIALVLFSLVLSACGPAEPTLDVDAQRTSFAQTANVQATMTAEALPTSTPTQEPTVTSTPTPEVTPTLSGTESTEETPVEGETPSATPTTAAGGGTDAAMWRANDPPDNTNFEPGEAFTVTWTIENVGSSTWTTEYYIQFSSGEAMGVDPDAKFTLPYPVSPNTSMQISVDLVAPGETGEKRSDWKLYNFAGIAFYDFYIIIDVLPPGATEEPSPTPTETTTP